MKSIKRGRGPSMQNGVGYIIAAVFGVLWTILSASMMQGAAADFGGFGAAGTIFPLLGVVFTVGAIAGAVYHFRNATAKNRYSELDITEEGEEPDPLQEKYGEKLEKHYCPACGAKVGKDDAYCAKCGKKL